MPKNKTLNEKKTEWTFVYIFDVILYRQGSFFHFFLT